MKKSLKSKILWWMAGIVVAIFLSVRLYYALTDDFRLGNITYEMPYEKEWNIGPVTPEQEHKLEAILDQSYSYLAKGAQSYVFVSADGRYVLKFFKFKHLRPSLFLDALPSIGPLKTYKDKQAARKERKLYGVFNSYKLAYDNDKLESGLVFIQLNTVDNPKRTVSVVDKLGITRTIALDKVPFILQDRGEILRTVLRKLLEKGDVETAKKRVGRILDLYADEYRKGIFDHDHGVMQNSGFVGDRPIHLDVGKLMKEDKMREREHARRDMLLVAAKINAWVGDNFPQYAPPIAAYLEQRINAFY